MNSCWLTLVHTLALLRTWPCTLSYGVFLMHNTHTHVQRTCTHQFYMWQTIHLSDDGTNTLTHKHYCHMHIYSIQSTDCISICVPSLHNTHMHTHRHTGHFIGNRTTLKPSPSHILAQLSIYILPFKLHLIPICILQVIWFIKCNNSNN